MHFQLVYYFPLLAIPILLLLYRSGPLNAAGLTVFSTLIGTVAFIFSSGDLFSGKGFGERIIPLIFLLQTVWLWVLFWIAERSIESKNLVTHRLQEELEKIELSGLDYQQKQKDTEQFCNDIMERISRYSRLRIFTNQLAENLKLSDVRKQTEQSVQKLFSWQGEVKTELRLFSFPNSPDGDDTIGEWIVKQRIPLLITDTAQDLRFKNKWFKKNTSIIACPIFRESSVVGVLTIESDSSKKWKEEDLRFLSDISNIVSLSIANAVYYEKVESLAVKDSLTGLFVRYRFDERIEEEFTRSKVNGSPMSFILFDIDHFKKVNDQWGHPAGDLVLQVVSQIVLDQTRETDFCARYGGEEIAVIMPLTSLENSYQIAERIRKNIESTVIGNEKIKVTVSGGLSSVHASLKNVSDLIQDADRSLYEAKNKGRNRLIKTRS